MKGDPRTRGFATRAVHAGQPPDPTTGAVAVPIYQTSTYVQDRLGDHKGYEYARVQNPTRSALEENLAILEGGLHGHAFASGMSAISALLTLMRAGDHAVCSRNVYGGTYRLFHQVLERYELTFSWVDSAELEEIEKAMTDRTRLVYIETPTNPMMEITDISGAAGIAHANGAILAVDNTFMSPFLQRPLELGADVVIHSTTKFLNGHSDSIGGALVSKNPEHAEWFAFVQKSAGAILSPFDSFLVLRGIKTLPVRMERQQASAHRIAHFLGSHPKIRSVIYPGLESHPGHDIHYRQASGAGALISFDLGDLPAAGRFLDALEVLSLGESLGGVETLISHPASMTHASISPEHRELLGIGDGLVRVSVGLEECNDLLADVELALTSA
jgi:cystathionine beta-lyase/cystathionine gamma-synthase